MPNQTTVITNQKTQVLDVTAACNDLIGGTQNGIAVFNVLHTTAALLVGENDSDLFGDMVHVAQSWLADSGPFRHGRHSNPNAEAHILGAFAGSSLTLPIVDGKLLLGTWQRILLMELDGPKRRSIIGTTMEMPIS